METAVIASDMQVIALATSCICYTILGIEHIIELLLKGWHKKATHILAGFAMLFLAASIAIKILL